MRLLLMTSTIRAISESLFTPWAVIRSQSTVQNQMILQCLWSFKAGSTKFALEAFNVAVNNHVHLQSSLSVEGDSTNLKKKYEKKLIINKKLKLNKNLTLHMYWVTPWVSSWVFKRGKFLNFLSQKEQAYGKFSLWIIKCSLSAPFVLKFLPQLQQR